MFQHGWTSRNNAKAKKPNANSSLLYDPIYMLLLSCFSRVWLCATPWMAAHQAPLSLGFSRQEHWSGLPFPSPMHEREKWKWSRSVMSDSSRPQGLQPTRLLRPWDFPGKSTGVGCHCLLQQFIWGVQKRQMHRDRKQISFCLGLKAVIGMAATGPEGSSSRHGP